MQHLRPAWPRLVLVLCQVAAAIAASPAQAQTFTVLHGFRGLADGGAPFAGVIRDSAGNLYGTASAGGTSNAGVVFKLDASGTYSVLHSFAGHPTDGASPLASVTLDAAGNLYGTIFGGGTHNMGVVFKVDAGGTETILYNFCSQTGCADGAGPTAGVIRDSAGNFYGTTSAGGATNSACVTGCGTVFKLDPAGKETVLYKFTGGSDGARPAAVLLRDSAGNLYGTTLDGGGSPNCTNNVPSGCGTVFKLDATGTETILYQFTGGNDGGNPGAGVIRDSAGNLYGTTEYGGAHGWGTVFKLDSTGRETIVYNFCSQSGCTDGQIPVSGLIRDSAGHLYGTTSDGGSSTSFGVVFRIDLAGTETVLYKFSGCEGAHPYAGVIRGPAGDFYGTTYGSGLLGCDYGAVFKLTP